MEDVYPDMSLPFKKNGGKCLTRTHLAGNISFFVSYQHRFLTLVSILHHFQHLLLQTNLPFLKRMTSVEKKTELSHASLYGRYALAGSLCASLTHTVLVPLDVVKTRLQVKYIH
jgi:hypothetical protein